MDCEKFDRVVLDVLYEELDELTSASAKRHTEHCTRCRRIVAELRATREVGSLPLIEPPESLEARILELEQQARSELPLRKRVGRAISILASYAMRPQLAMAALLLLMIGSSLLVFRAHPEQRNVMRVTERGVPESEAELPPVAASAAPEEGREEAEPAAMLGKPEPAAASTAAARTAPVKGEVAAGAAPAGAAPAADGSPLADANRALAERRFADAERGFDAVAEQGGGAAPLAALRAAEAARDGRGCAVAVERFEQVSVKYASSPAIAEQATWQAAECYRALGQVADARRSYETLLASETFQQRAQTALDSLGQTVASRAKSRPAAKAAAPAAPAAPSAAPAPAATVAPLRDSAVER